MKSLLEKFKINREDYTDTGWKKYLEKLVRKVESHNYYEIMGISMAETVNQKQLTCNYRRLALFLHPDKNSGKIYEDASQELFKIVSNAYEVLKDPKQESSYRLSQSRYSSAESTSYSTREPSSHSTFKTTSAPSDIDFSNLFAAFGMSGARVKVNKTTFSSGGNVFFQSSPERDEVINGDVGPGQLIKTKSANIIVKGNVYGRVKSMSGNITVQGSVFGIVETMSGDNNIYKGIKSGGKVSTISGNNYIQGETLGTYSTMSGQNIINGEYTSEGRQGTTFTVYYS